MRKRAEVNEADKMYIKACSDKSSTELSSLLNLSSEKIDEFRATLAPEQKPFERNPDGLAYEDKSTVHKMMSSPRVPGVTVLNQSVSEVLDETAKKYSKTKYMNPNTICNPKPKKS